MNWGISKVLVGNKCDIEESREVTYEEAVELAKDLDMNYFETSAKDGHNVCVVFSYVTRDILAANYTGSDNVIKLDKIEEKKSRCIN